jgi:glyoxylase I family protein
MDIQLHHFCIETNVYEQTKHFYIDILGFQLLKETEQFHNRQYNSWLKNNNVLIELQTPKTPINLNSLVLGTIGIVHICFHVKNLNTFLDQIEQKTKINYFTNKRMYIVNDSNLSKIIAPEGTIIEFREDISII